jgi:hypothetical protein
VTCRHCTEIVRAVAGIAALKVDDNLKLVLIRAALNAHPPPRRKRRRRRGKLIKLVPPPSDPPAA